MVERIEANGLAGRSFPPVVEDFDAEILKAWHEKGAPEFAVWVVQTHIEGSARAYAADVEAAVAIVADLQRKFPAVFAALADLRAEVTRV